MPPGMYALRKNIRAASREHAALLDAASSARDFLEGLGKSMRARAKELEGHNQEASERY